jgi:hypothetical protein
MTTAGRLRLAEQCRVVVDNDWAGDPDGLVALAHHLLSPTNRVVAVTGSFLNPAFGPLGSTAQRVSTSPASWWSWSGQHPRLRCTSATRGRAPRAASAPRRPPRSSPRRATTTSCRWSWCGRTADQRRGRARRGAGPRRPHDPGLDRRCPRCGRGRVQPRHRPGGRRVRVRAGRPVDPAVSRWRPTGGARTRSQSWSTTSPTAACSGSGSGRASSSCRCPTGSGSARAVAGRQPSRAHHGPERRVEQVRGDRLAARLHRRRRPAAVRRPARQAARARLTCGVDHCAALVTGSGPMVSPSVLRGRCAA